MYGKLLYSVSARRPASLRLSHAAARYAAQSAHRHVSSDVTLPRVASSSLWANLIPKPFRRSSQTSKGASTFLSKDWNPATFFILISLLIGSNSIQIIGLERNRVNYQRSTDAKLAQLREVVERVQNGEEFDIRAALGTGDPEKEKEWATVMEDLENSDDLRSWKAERDRREKSRKARGESATGEQEEDGVDDDTGRNALDKALEKTQHATGAKGENTGRDALDEALPNTGKQAAGAKTSSPRFL